MDDSPDGANPLVVALLVVALIAGAWYWWHRTGADPLDQVADVFAPAPEEFNERQEQIDRAEQLVDRINRRQRGDDAPE